MFSEHTSEIATLFIAVVLLGMAALTALIVFTRWVVHTEVKVLTAAMHKDITAIGARLDVLVGRHWTDDRLKDEFATIRSVLNAQAEALAEIRREHYVNHPPTARRLPSSGEPL